MGTSIAELVGAADDLELAGIWQRGADLAALAAGSDVVIDFSLPEATAEVVAAVEHAGVPLVCGVSGLGDEQLALLERAARSVAVLYDRNMSQGIAVLEDLVRRAARALGGRFDVAIRETHHVHKKDAPSGTALKLGEAIAGALGIDPVSIGYESERRGEVPGDHVVTFASETEVITLGHSVTTRAVFAEGAIRAARWIVGRPPGCFTMHDVLE